MFPMYRDMNSYPYQTPFPQFYNPNWESLRPQLKEDRASTHQMHEYRPDNYGYPAPMPCQNCCTHGQHPSYYNFRPPCPHFPLPPPYGHYYGGYPASYPPPYPYIPPPHYSMEMPRYEYDKSSPKAFHCCECPNHTHHVKNANNVKIEEHDPDVKTRKVKSLLPAEGGSSQSPILWIPPGYMMNNERPKQVVETDPNEQRGSSDVEQPNQDPNVNYKWFPLDMNSIRQLLKDGDLIKPRDNEKKDGDEKKALDVKKKDQNKLLSYPTIWMPYGGQGGDRIRGQEGRNIGKTPSPELEARSKDQQPVEEHPSTSKHPDKQLVKHVDDNGTLETHKPGIVKIIPVKQLDESLEKKRESEVKGTPQNTGAIANQESVKNGIGMKPSSPTKKSKLPPICLRVDPPRKKNGKGGSRSPSPPGEKQNQCLKSGNPKAERKNKEGTQVEENVNDTALSHGIKELEKRSCTPEHQSDAERKVVQDASKSDNTQGAKGSEHVEIVQSEHDEIVLPKKKIPSEMEAAVIIQSAYRGFAVRRWEPLEKLRQIASVRQEAGKVKGKIDMLETSARVDNKEKIAIGETIMNLLLKLDTIQGLHPSVRDARKMVAKELINLQEKLDCIVGQNSTPLGPSSSSGEEVQGHPTTSAAGSPEVVSDASRISEQFDAFDEDIIVEAQKDGEYLSFGKDHAGQTLASQEEVGWTENGNTSEINEEYAVESQSGKVMLPIGGHSEYEEPALLLEAKEEEPALHLATNEEQLDKTATSLEDSSMGFQDLDGAGILDDTQPTNIVQEFPQETVEHVGDDICRMDWECDLGAAKITCDTIDQEASLLAESSREIEAHAVNTSDPTRVCYREGTVDEKNNVLLESHEEVVKENGEGASAVGWTENGNTSEINEEYAVESQSGKVMLPIGGHSEYEEPALLLEAKEEEPALHLAMNEEQLDKTATSLEDSSMGFQDLDGAGILDDTQPTNMVQEFPKETVEHVGDDICRMDWECDLGAAKITCDTLDQEASLLAESSREIEAHAVNTSDPTRECYREGTVDEKNNVLLESHEGVKENGEGASAVERSRAETKDEEKVHAKPEVKRDDVDHENHASAEIFDKRDPDALESETSNGHERVETPVPEVEKEVIIEDRQTDGGESDLAGYLQGETMRNEGEEQLRRRLIEENDKLKNMVEKLLASGKQQQDVISNLSAKVKNLEKKIPAKNKMRLAKGKRPSIIVSHRCHNGSSRREGHGLSSGK